MSMDTFEKMQFDSEVYFKLEEADREAEETEKRYSAEDVLSAVKAAIKF